MITAEARNELAGTPATAPRLRRLVRAICRRLGVSQAVVSVGVVGDAGMRRLNAKFLHRRGNTDCLSFDLSDGTGPEQPRLFDLIVNGELAAREAARRGHAAEAELALYVAHG